MFSFFTYVALLAEAEVHNPDISCPWNRVDLAVWTHPSQGLTRNDYMMAAKIDGHLAR